MRALSSLRAAWAAQHPEDTHVPNHRSWASLTWRDFDSLDRGRTVAVLPVAAIEQHGPPAARRGRPHQRRHARRGARAHQSGDAAARAARVRGRQERRTRRLPGTLTLSTGTLSRVWFRLRRIGAPRGAAQDRLRQLARRAVARRPDRRAGPARAARHGRGGCEHLRLRRASGAVPRGGVAARDSRRRGRDLADAAPRAGSGARRSRRRIPARIGGARGARPRVRFHGNGALAWATQDLPVGACGDARQASARAGAQVLEHVAGRLAALLDEVAARSPRCATGPPGSLRGADSARLRASVAGSRRA